MGTVENLKARCGNGSQSRLRIAGLVKKKIRQIMSFIYSEGGMSARKTARFFNNRCKTVAKILRHELLPLHRRSAALLHPILDGYVSVIDGVTEYR